jgi:hypothetical protein
MGQTPPISNKGMTFKVHQETVKKASSGDYIEENGQKA